MKCTRDGCAREATHAPRICVPALGHPRREATALKVLAGVKLCRDHAKAFDMMSFIETPKSATDPSTPKSLVEEMIRAQRRALPDWRLAWVSPIRLDSAEFLEFEAAGQTQH